MHVYYINLHMCHKPKQQQKREAAHVKVAFVDKYRHKGVQNDRRHEHIVKNPKTSVLQNDILVRHIVEHRGDNNTALRAGIRMNLTLLSGRRS